MGDPCTEPTVFNELVEALDGLGWPYQRHVVPDNTSPYYLDVSLAEKIGKPVGLLVAGRHDSLSVGLPGEAHPTKESGPFSLQRRLLQARGWETVVVNADRWAALAHDQRRAFLQEVVARDGHDVKM